MAREHQEAARTRVFGKYADVYDALYQDKDYEGECDFLERTFREHEARPTRSILDLGCGTGGHALPLAKRGYEVLGVDRSSEMVANAREKAADALLEVEFAIGNVCDLNLERTFDAVTAMFAVVSYQCSDEDLGRMMRSVRRHLEPGGLFVFDVWYGPAVLAQRPTKKSKAIELADGEKIRRSATPSLNMLSHTVEVSYRVTRTKGEQVLEETNESHLVRFFFPPEITRFLTLAGLELLQTGPFMEPSRQPTEADWNISVIARAVG